MMNLMLYKNFEAIECCACACTFAITDSFLKHLKENKQLFYCPNGHTQSFTRKPSDLIIEKKNVEILRLESELAKALSKPPKPKKKPWDNLKTKV